MTKKSVRTVFDILLVEDNDFDARRIERALSRLGVPHRLERAVDGRDALDILRRSLGRDQTPDPASTCKPGDTRSVHRPFVVFLDLNMPVMGGLVFLEHLREDRLLAATQVVVITTSEFYKDVERAHAHNVCGYIVKPVSGEEMVEATGKVIAFLEKCTFAH